MPSRTSQTAQVGKRKVELSNLTKVLFPEDHIVKAQLIEYYFKIAPTILAHVKGRPLSLVRYPDGISGGSFFQKNRPDWAPSWVEHVTLGEEQKDYVIATEDASLVWLANLACIELHQMHSRAPRFDRPDYIVFDLDPPENFRFPDVAALALEFKEHLEGFGYHAFVKTTGRKGLHVLAPIETKRAFPEAFEAAKAVAQPFVDSHASSLTLHIKKELRKGKVLLDIYRNRQFQTIVAAYSVRGLAGAPVSTLNVASAASRPSMPLTTSASERPCTLACTKVRKRPFSLPISLGPNTRLIFAICPSGIALPPGVNTSTSPRRSISSRSSR